jgi:glycosyltransferase involved in cell wall biosynthesis
LPLCRKKAKPRLIRRLPILIVKKMKIVRIIARLNVGGPARHVVWLTKELQNEEFESVLLAGTVPAGEEDMSWFAEENGVKPIYIEEMSRELSAKDIVSLWKVYREIKKNAPDIIHAHTAKAGTIGRIGGFFYRLLSRKKVKIIHTFHGHIFHSYYGNLKTKIFLTIEKILARLATDKIIVISQRQFEEIHEEFGIGRKEQFEIIPLGIDLEKFAEADAKKNILRDEISAKADEILVGFVGRLTEIKNISLFLRVAKIYLEKRDADLPKLKFLIIGDGNLREKLEAESASLNLGETVNFLGNRADADVFYAGLDVVALTSLNEGTPLSLIEAMANAKAVISTSVGGVVDLLGEIKAEKDGYKICERGVSAESNDAEGFFRGLLKLVKDKDLQAEFGVKGKTFVQENYSKNRLFEDLKRLYLKLQNNQ